MLIPLYIISKRILIKGPAIDLKHTQYKHVKLKFVY